MTEPPFRPREKLAETQRYFQSIHRHTYLKGPFDKITSVAIPLALAVAGSSLFLIESRAVSTMLIVPYCNLDEGSTTCPMGLVRKNEDGISVD